MLPRFVRLTILTAFVGLLAVPAAHADTRVFVQLGIPGPMIPAPVVAGPVYAPPVYAPYPGYIWRAGYYVPTPYGPRWVAGAWVPRAYHYRGWGHGPRGHWDRRAYGPRGWRR